MLFVTILLFILGLLLIIKGGDIFVDSASWIAKKSGIPNFIIGATIVSFATTMPEMVASIIGTIEGQLGMAIGNAIGSVTANTGMIMAISIMFIPAVFDRKQYAFKSILLIFITLVLGLFVLSGDLNLLESILVLTLALLFIIENIIKAKEVSQINNTLPNNVDSKEETKEEEQESNKTIFKKILSNEPISPKVDLIINIIKFLLGALGIYFGAKLLVDNGTIIAKALGVSDAIIGLTLLAIGTSLPELVTTITAIVKKQSSLSIGNIVGANIIDMSVILPVCGLISGGKLELESMQTAYLDIPVSLAVMLVALVPAIITKKFKRWQGFVMLAIYIAYLVVICTNLIHF